MLTKHHAVLVGNLGYRFPAESSRTAVHHLIRHRKKRAGAPGAQIVYFQRLAVANGNVFFSFAEFFN